MQLDAATLLGDSRVPPGNRLERLAGDRARQYSIRIKELSVPPRRINEIVLGKRGITADTALRLSRFFGTSARFWLNLQTGHDLAVEEDRLRGRLVREVHRMRHAG